MFGTSPTSAYIESSSGVAAGGRTGLTSVIVAILFILSAFFGPLVGAVSGLSAITAPALIIVGSLMMGSIAKISWDELDEAFPAFLIILSMPLTFKYRNRNCTGIYLLPTAKNSPWKMAGCSSASLPICGIIFLSTGISATLSN